MKPFFSVLVAVYNRPALVRAALDSVLAQTYRDFEIVVVDDGSDDETPSVLSSFGDRIRVIRQANRGPSTARNAGFAAAQGRYVCVLDSDDKWFPWTLATFDRVLRECSSPVFLAGELVSFVDESQLQSIAESGVRYQAFRDYLEAAHRGYFAGSGMAVYEREAVAAIGGFDARLRNLEDHDVALRLGVSPGFVKILAPFTLAYRYHSGSIQSVERGYEGLVACLQKEATGQYPGGEYRRRERRLFLTLHARPLSLRCAEAGHPQLAWRLYRQTFWWHLAQGRFRYLIGFPMRRGWAVLRHVAWR